MFRETKMMFWREINSISKSKEQICRQFTKDRDEGLIRSNED